jgi:1-acyl-sn-glycerol-3-phosphate acyltransferase
MTLPRIDPEPEPKTLRDPRWERGRLLRWLHRREHASWGTDPAQFDAALVQRTLALVSRLFGPGRYFDVDVKGWENLPAGPVMIVSNHSGGTSIPDVWGFLSAWYRNYGVGRPIHPVAHEMILATRLTGRFFSRRGIVRANREVALSVLRDHRHDLMVMPGGDLDAWRPYKARHQVRFSGRVGYAHTALKAGVPIVPVAHTGAHETFVVLSDGRWIARAMGLPALARASIWPVHLSLPWGLAFGPWPHLPLPARLRYRIGPPLMPPERIALGEEPREALVKQYDVAVQAAVQRLLDELKATG